MKNFTRVKALSLAKFQFHLKMKMTTLLLIIVLFQVNANNNYAQRTKISVDLRNVPIEQVLDKIESITNFEFFVNVQEIDINKQVNVKANKQNISRILNDIFENENLEFKIIDKQISIRTSTNIIKVDRQDKNISGIVTDQNGVPIAGVNILVKETAKGTQTDFDGKYSMNASETDILTFSFLGYQTQQINVLDKTIINVVMKEQASKLDEIVVVGYGTQKKEDLTGSISNISLADFESRPITSLSAGLSGLAPGIQITQSSGGRIGSNNASIRIRGIGTLNNSNPLVLVDGVSSSMNDIDPNDVASISILKDAASAAIYGSRAANGVILITTKKGTEGTLSISYNAYVGWQQATKKQEYVTDFALWMELANENRTNGNQSPIFPQADIDEWRNSNNPLTHPNVDWYDIQTGSKAFLQSHSISVSGGSQNTTYRFSLGYLDQDGLQKPNGQKRYNVRTHLESEIAKGFKLGTNLFYRWTDLNPRVNTSNGSGVDFNIIPGIPDIRSPDGRWGGSQHTSVGIVFNPLWNLTISEQNNRQQRFLGSIFSDWEIVKGLKFMANLSLNRNTALNRNFNLTGKSWNFREDIIDRERTQNSASSSHTQNYLITNFYTLDYEKNFDDHNLNVLAGYQHEIYRQDNVRASIQEFPGNALQVIDAGLSNPSVGGSAAEWAIRSYFGRLNYNFLDKYFLEANIRTDGSSRFREGKKWGTFPSVSLGWRISEEAFMLDILPAPINELKVRVSSGKLGNQSIGNYPYQSTYNLNQNYSFGGTVVSGIAQNNLSNQDISWEETTTSNIGLDAGLFDNRLELTFEYFNRKTDGILFAQQIPRFLGAKGAPTVNLAEVVNKGWEASASYRENVGDDFNFNIGGHITQLDNEVTKFFGDTFSGGTFVIQEGQPFRAIRGYEADGIFQSTDEIADAPTHPGAVTPGDIRYKDQITVDTDGDGILDSPDGLIDSNDRVIIGNTIPKFLLGVNLGAEYKNFDLSVIIQGVLDVDTYAGGGFAYQAFAQNDRGLVADRWLDRWTPENPNNDWPRLVDGTAYNGNRQTSSFWVNDISYLRLKNIQLGYRLPTTIIKNLGINKARVYLSADNLLTLTNWIWDFDPERSQTAGTPGLPNLTTFIFGVNVDF